MAVRVKIVKVISCLLCCRVFPVPHIACIAFSAIILPFNIALAYKHGVASSRQLTTFLAPGNRTRKNEGGGGGEVYPLSAILPQSLLLSTVPPSLPLFLHLLLRSRAKARVEPKHSPTSQPLWPIFQSHGGDWEIDGYSDVRFIQWTRVS